MSKITKIKSFIDQIFQNTSKLQQQINLNLRTHNELILQDKQLDDLLIRQTTRISMEESAAQSDAKKLKTQIQILKSQIENIGAMRDARLQAQLGPRREKQSGVIIQLQNDEIRLQQLVLESKNEQKQNQEKLELCQKQILEVQRRRGDVERQLKEQEAEVEQIRQLPGSDTEIIQKIVEMEEQLKGKQKQLKIIEDQVKVKRDEVKAANLLKQQKAMEQQRIQLELQEQIRLELLKRQKEEEQAKQILEKAKLESTKTAEQKEEDGVLMDQLSVIQQNVGQSTGAANQCTPSLLDKDTKDSPLVISLEKTTEILAPVMSVKQKTRDEVPLNDDEMDQQIYSECMKFKSISEVQQHENHTDILFKPSDALLEFKNEQAMDENEINKQSEYENQMKKEDSTTEKLDQMEVTMHSINPAHDSEHIKLREQPEQVQEIFSTEQHITVTQPSVINTFEAIVPPSVNNDQEPEIQKSDYESQISDKQPPIEPDNILSLQQLLEPVAKSDSDSKINDNKPPIEPQMPLQSQFELIVKSDSESQIKDNQPTEQESQINPTTISAIGQNPVIPKPRKFAFTKSICAEKSHVQEETEHLKRSGSAVLEQSNASFSGAVNSWMKTSQRSVVGSLVKAQRSKTAVSQNSSINGSINGSFSAK